MGIIWRAEDTRLQRQVALKFLPEHTTTDRQMRERFLREARAASALNHPHICTVYDVGEHGGHPFIALELLEGETLAGRLTSAPLPTEAIVNWGAKIADALSAAPDNRILHRDIKPGNIFITDRGEPKVLDFGLAKLAPSPGAGGADHSEQPTAAAEGLHLTSPGSTLGTVAYMSPEQALGEPLDVRSDIFSLGVVLYEMATGKRAFTGNTSAAVFNGILNRAPTPPAQLNPGLPAELVRILGKALEKDRHLRFQHASDLRTDLVRLQRDTDTGRSTALPAASAPSVTADAPVAREAVSASSDAQVIASVLVRRKKTVLSAAATILIALVITAYAILRPGGESSPPLTQNSIHSLAVLPFENVGGNPDREYLSDGITESLINSLAGLPGIRVVSRNSAFRYKEQQANLAKIGKELGVGALVTGRVQQRAGTLIVGVELVDLARDAQLWGHQYNRQLADIFRVQEDIARAVTDQLQIRLTGEENARLTRRSTENPEAYQLYLKGRHHWNKRTEAGIRKAIESFQAAIDLDPTYALGYAGLADCYVVLSDYSDVPAAETWPLVEAAALKAIELDPSLAQPHAALANIYMPQLRWRESEEKFKVALAMEPDYATAHHWYGLLLWIEGRSEEAIHELEIAKNLDPLSMVINWTLGESYYYARRYDDAIQQLHAAIELDPSFPGIYGTLGTVHYLKGEYEEWLQAWLKNLELRGERDTAARARKAFEDSGPNGLLQVSTAFFEQSPNRPHGILAGLYAQLGETEQALDSLESGFREHELVILLDPIYDPIRTHPRFQELKRRLNLP